MPLYCCAFNCQSKHRKGGGVSFYRFPKSADLREKWVQAVNRDNWTPTSNTVLCSLHFEEKWLDRTGQTCRLRIGAIPTIFNFSSNLSRSKKKILKQSSDSPPSTSKGIGDRRIKQEHFEESQFEQKRVDGRRVLKRNAVPTIFDRRDRKAGRRKIAKRIVVEYEKSKSDEEADDPRSTNQDHSAHQETETTPATTSTITTRSSAKQNAAMAKKTGPSSKKQATDEKSSAAPQKGTGNSRTTKTQPAKPQNSSVQKMESTAEDKTHDISTSPTPPPAPPKTNAKRATANSQSSEGTEKKGVKRKKILAEDLSLLELELSPLVASAKKDAPVPATLKPVQPPSPERSPSSQMVLRRGRGPTTCETACCQTDLTMADISKMERDLVYLNKEIGSLRKKVLEVDFTEQTLKESDEEVEFYTGMPSLTMLMTVFNFITPHVNVTSNKLNNFTEFLMLMIHVRLNLSLADIGSKFGTTLTLVFRIVDKWLTAMHEHLGIFVSWPERQLLLDTMPSDFKALFGERVAVIVDCFEVYIDKNVASSSASVLAGYKHQDTVKFLVGITPQGVISYISEAWDGRIRDQDVIERSDILDYLLPGDIVIACSGFGFYCAQVVETGENATEKSLVNVEMPQNQMLSRLKIHIDKFIGLLCNKFQIIKSPLYVEFSDRKETLDYIQRVVRVCCALTNLSNSGLTCEVADDADPY